MKATGIVRRIDDLGRVVIPKEIRRTLRIREGDPLEIFTDREGEVILKKYSPIGELSAFARQYAESLAHVSGCLAFICDMDQVIAAAGSGKKEVEEQYISKPLEKVLEARRAQCASSDEKKYVKVLAEQEENYSWEIIQPILCDWRSRSAFKRREKEVFTDRRKTCNLCRRFFGTSNGILMA